MHNTKVLHPDKLPLLILKGGLDENFYHLGLHDKALYNASFDHIHALIGKTKQNPLKAAYSVFEGGLKTLINIGLKLNPQHHSIITPYAEGLGLAPSEVAYVFLIPEIISSLGKWLPKISWPVWGCSSFFYRDNTGEIIHGRILDFPLIGSFDLHERAILYQIEDGPQIFGYNSIGFPYPSLTAMTENGIGLSVHQKFTTFFDPLGTPIFELIFKLLQTAKDLESALAFLKKARSITTWGLYLSFPNGQVLALDIQGKNIKYEVHSLKKQEILYFNNNLISDPNNSEPSVPMGIANYNEMRSKRANQAINKFNFDAPAELELLKLMATPYSLSSAAKKTEKTNTPWQLSPLTPCSLSITTLSPTKQRSLAVTGSAPKVFLNKYLEFSNLWTRPKQILKKGTSRKSTKKSADFQSGFRHLGLAQKAFENKDKHNIYHHHQMAIQFLDQFPEKTIAQFFFNINRYLYETETRDLATILHQFLEILDKLPPYLNDHCLLFCRRIEYMLYGQPKTDLGLIKSPDLQKIWHIEMKIPKKIFHVTTSKLIVPRIEIMDVLYLHSHIG